MNVFERRMLLGIIRRTVDQGGQWERTVDFLSMVAQAWQRQYYEDNSATVKADLREMFESALSRLK